MFNLARNEFTVFYKQYVGKQEVLDSNGYKTGSFAVTYGTLESAKMYVSANRGSAQDDMFGNLEVYDRTLITSDVNCTMNEDSIVWLDGADTNQPHNYVVKKRAPWKNSIAFALLKVTVQ